MNLKFPILVAAGLFLATVSKAQYAAPCYNPRVVVETRPVPVYAYGYIPRDHRDWRFDEYERYCRDHRDYRGDRRVFYRDRYNYRVAPFSTPRRVVMYR
jgi:hypothetical protein